MRVEYPLHLLRQEREVCRKKIKDMDVLKSEGHKINEREKTKYIHRLGQLEFAIEVLEDWEEEEF